MQPVKRFCRGFGQGCWQAPAGWGFRPLPALNQALKASEVFSRSAWTVCLDMHVSVLHQRVPRHPAAPWGLWALPLQNPRILIKPRPVTWGHGQHPIAAVHSPRVPRWGSGAGTWLHLQPQPLIFQVSRRSSHGPSGHPWPAAHLPSHPPATEALGRVGCPRDPGLLTPQAPPAPAGCPQQLRAKRRRAGSLPAERAHGPWRSSAGMAQCW